MTASELASYIRAAAEQRRWLIPRRRDRRLVTRGGTILHAVDTDIVVLYARPWDMAPRTERRKEGYAEIFPGENRQIVVSLGMALASCIFHGLSARLPLVMLPPMGEEVNDVFAAVARDAEREGERALGNLDQIQRLVHEAANMDDASQAVKRLAQHADQIARFLLGQEGATAELRRFGLLLRNTRIAPPEYLIDKGMIHDPVLCAALEPPVDLGDRLRFRTLQETWFDRLRKTKSRSQNPVRNHSDAQVLARLDWINARLTPPEDGAEPTHRVVLITGDQAMHAAAAAVPWERSDLSFGELFLRHPRAYLAEPGVLNPPEDTDQTNRDPAGDTQFDQWLDTWLGELNPGTDDFEEALDDLLRRDDEQLAEWVAPLITAQPRIEDKLRRAWSDYTRNLVLEPQRSDLALELARAQERGVIEEYKDLVDRLAAAVDERIRETWQGCFSVVAEGSCSLLLARSQRADSVRSRNPPLLTLDCFEKTHAFVEDVLRSYEAGGLTATQWNTGLEELKADDKSGYVFFLALGLLFAAEGIWKVAAILANRALTIAERQRPDHVSGREAAFLRAVALRRSARRVEDLAPVTRLLDRAEAAYQQDLAGYPTLRAGPCRFAAERVALSLSYHLYRIMLRAEIPDSIPTLEQIQAQIDNQISALAGSNERKNVILYTKRKLLVDWCMAALLRVKDQGLRPAAEAFSQHLEALERNINEAGADFRPSFRVEAIRRVATWLLTTDPVAKEPARVAVTQWLSEQKIEQHSVMKYDKERFQFLRDLVQSSLV